MATVLSVLSDVTQGAVVGFDLDDTLFSEYDFCRSAYTEIGERLNAFYSLDPDRIVSSMMSEVTAHRNPFDALESLLREAGIDVDVKDYVSMYRSHRPKSLLLVDGAAELLDQLKAGGCRLVLITDGRVGTQSAKIDALGLRRFFDDDDIYISQTTGHDKYDPDNFLSVMRRYPDAPSYTYIGDNPAKDFLHPNSLGWQTILIIQPFPTVHGSSSLLADSDFLPKKKATFL